MIAILRNTGATGAHLVVAVGAAAVAAVPGLLALRGRIQVPPGLEYQFAFGSWVLVGVVVLALLAVRRDPSRTSLKAVLRRAGLAVTVLMVTLLVYAGLQHRCLIELPILIIFSPVSKPVFRLLNQLIGSVRKKDRRRRPLLLN